MSVLAYISTRGRYDTTLLASMAAVINQSIPPNKFILFDDNDEPRDLRDDNNYLALFNLMDIKGIEWEVLFGECKGQHYNHQRANLMDFDWCWRIDDDVIVDGTSLEKLLRYADAGVGAIGGAILTPNLQISEDAPRSAKIDDIYTHASMQWFKIMDVWQADHLHCSFLYRPNVANYNLALSRVAHREETLFTYDLKRSGYTVMLVPNVTACHLKADTGGIRDGDADLYQHDEDIFRKCLDMGKLIVLDNGIGDHYMLKSILPEIKAKHGENITIACCYPDVFPGESIISIEQANAITNILEYNVYKKCIDWKLNGPLIDAFRRLYL